MQIHAINKEAALPATGVILEFIAGSPMGNCVVPEFTHSKPIRFVTVIGTICFCEKIECHVTILVQPVNRLRVP